MTAEDYRRAAVLFDQLRGLDSSERAAALEAGCSGNAELREEVWMLLSADRCASGGTFLDRRAMADAAGGLSEAFQLPAPGTEFASYHLGARIGAGGMGVVFEARDLRLRRRVALKILPPAFAGEAGDRLQRQIGDGIQEPA